VSSAWRRLVETGTAREEVPLAPLATYKLGGPADIFVEATSREALARVAEAMQADPRPILVLGRGSNLLISDAGFRGVVVRLGEGFGMLEVDPAGTVTAGGSVPLPRLARAAAEQGRGGLEWCVGVPGSVGGAVRQNAGCFGSEIVDVLVDAEVFDLRGGGGGIRAVDELDLSYRHSNLDPAEVVVSARFRTVVVDPAAAAQEMRRITRWRRDHQPGGTLNAGSVFKNPPGEAAGEIIDRLGLKGFGFATVRVSPRHGNFIEALPGASAADVRRLIDAVADQVVEATGVRLEPEIQFVGFETG
jgi:UDP-N-acetylmuramate dehydrogenase